MRSNLIIEVFTCISIEAYIQNLRQLLDESSCSTNSTALEIDAFPVE